jgi:hypothetical protein
MNGTVDWRPVLEVNGVKERAKSDIGKEIKDEHFEKGARDGVKSIQNNEMYVGKDIDREVKKDQRGVQKEIQ